MLYSVDRIENSRAVLLDGQGNELVLRDPAPSLREGMVLERTGTGAFVPRPQEADARRGEANRLLADILAKGSQHERNG